MQIIKIPVELTFTEPLLATASGNKDLHSEYIASKAPTLAQGAEEVEAIPTMEKAMTVFHADAHGIHLWDYQIRGFFKEALRALVETNDGEMFTKNACKRLVDNFLFITPRRIHILDKNAETIPSASIGTLTRPLRAETMQGPRVALATSQVADAGCRLRFQIDLLEQPGIKKPKDRLTRQHVLDALEYGKLKGLGQWRSGSYGRFDAIIHA